MTSNSVESPIICEPGSSGELEPSGEQLSSQLLQWFANADATQFVVALSGGVDSAVVAKAAFLSGRKCEAVTTTSPSVSTVELEAAKQLARQVGISHRILETLESTDEAYLRNDRRRCYHCKTYLYSTIAREIPDAIILNGTNLDDLGDYRPGLQAADESGVRSPLVEMRLNKSAVRRVAKFWDLPVHAKPASPCLASRVAYGVAVTPERLQMVEAAEAVLRDWELTDLRVRVHEGDLVRIEVPIESIRILLEGEAREAICTRLKALGFSFVTLDLAGLRSGSLNDLIQISHPDESRGV